MRAHQNEVKEGVTWMSVELDMCVYVFYKTCIVIHMLGAKNGFAQSIGLHCANHGSVLCAGNPWIVLRTRTFQCIFYIYFNIFYPCTCRAGINQLAS